MHEKTPFLLVISFFFFDTILACNLNSHLSIFYEEIEVASYSGYYYVLILVSTK